MTDLDTDLDQDSRSGAAVRRTLPSGRTVVLHRPRGFASERWEIAGSGGLYRVRRLRRGNSAEYEYAKDGGSRPLSLVEADARALVTLLNDLLREASDRALAKRAARSRRAG